MNFLLEKQNRQYFMFLFVSCVCMLFLLLFFGYTEVLRAENLLFAREGQLVSALLIEGVPAERIASACSSSVITEAGSDLLAKIGHQNQTPFFFFPVLQKHAFLLALRAGAAGLLFCAVFLMGAAWHMKKRDRLYEEAAEQIERFTRGDFSGHLPMENQKGTICRLFASVDQLARAMRAGYETENHSKQFLKDMISDISHQLKTPLAALNLYTDIIAGEPEHPDTVRTFSQKSMESLLRMEELIQSLLKIVRLDAGSISFDRTEVLVRDLVLRAAALFGARAERENKQIQIADGKEERMFADPIWTSEAIGNLIKNALDHTKEGGVIRIGWERSPVMLRLFVADNGCGIAQEDIYHIFKRFYRSSRSADRQGVGLGLPLAKAIIEGQGGTLSVASEEGEGTVFYVSLFYTKSEVLQNRKTDFTGM